MPGILGMIGAQAAGAGMGLLLQGQQDRRQLSQQQKLQQIEIKGQKEMTEYNYNKQLQLWKDTNYQAQIEQLKKAGLNPALIYGMGGGGGQTANIESGHVATSQAPTGGQEIQSMMGMGLALQQAQIENIKAQTEKTKAETTNVPLTGENIKADTTIKQITASIDSSRETIIQATQNQAVAMAFTELRKATAEMHQAETQQKITAETAANQIRIVQAELAGILAQNTLKNSETKLNQSRINEIAESIKQKWSQIDINATDVQIKQKLQEFETDFGKQYGTFAAILVRLLHGGN